MSIQVGGGGYLIGFDGCFNPFNPSGAFATSITFSTSASLYDGWDWYFDPISFSKEKYFYDVATRAITYGGSNKIMKHKPTGIKIYLGKCFYRSSFRALYSYI